LEGVERIRGSSKREMDTSVPEGSAKHIGVGECREGGGVRKTEKKEQS